MTELSKLLKGANKLVLTEIADLTGLSKTTFVPGDAYQSAYNEGIRSIGLRLIHIAETEVAEVVTETYRKRNLKWKK